MSTERVEKLLSDIRLLSEEHYAIVQSLRDAVLSIDLSIDEEVKYGGLLFSAGPRFCGIFSYAQHVSLELSRGAGLPDPYGNLEGKGKFRRHIKFRSPSDLADTHARDYLEMAYKAAQQEHRR